MMDLVIRQVGRVQVVEIAGEIDGSTAPTAQSRVLALVQPGAAILLDMTRLTYMSSAGLRMLLSTHRTVASRDTRLVLVGLVEEIRDTMSATGFLPYFTTLDTLDEGLAALNE